MGGETAIPERPAARVRCRAGQGLRILGPLAALALSGCSSQPILTYSSEAPAQVLAPVATAGIEDGRARFRKIFCERFDAIGAPKDGKQHCGAYLHALSDEPATPDETPAPRIPLESVRFVIVPGFMGDAAPGGMRTLGPSIDRLAGMGYRIEYLQVSGVGGSGYNADQIEAYFRAREYPDNEKLVVIGHSKGATDLMRFLVDHPQLARQVDAMVSYAGAVNGTPLAEVFPQFLIDTIGFLMGTEAGDRAGFQALKPSVQMPWLAAHPLPAHVRYFSMSSFTDRDNVSGVLVDGYDRLSKINAKNDGQLIFYDQIIPGSTLLGYANGDHWAIALPFTEKAPGMASTFVDKNVFPRDAMLEAVLLYVRESL